MLRALLHGKLGGFGFVGGPKADEEPVEQADAGERDAAADQVASALARDEDSLTATIFGRLAYLPTDLAWDILSEAIQVHHGTPPPRLPNGLAPTFWPRWRPHALDAERRYVEPDMVIPGHENAILVEVKWQGAHELAQCVREVRAAAAKMPDRRLWLLLVGRRLRDRAAVGELARQIAQSCGGLDCLGGVATLDWADLGGAIRTQRRSTEVEPHIGRVLVDLDEALRWRGIHERIEFRTLPRTTIAAGSYAALVPALVNSPDLHPLPAARIRASSLHALRTW